MINLLKRIKVLTLCAFLASPATAAVYYVATTGNDANTTVQAQNPATPWRTGSHAAPLLSAGDTVNVASGWYAERIPLTISGTSGNPITWNASGATNWGFQGSQDVSYQNINNFFIHNTNAYGSSFDTPDFSGIYCRGAYWVISNNFIWECGQLGIMIDGRTNAGFTGVYSNLVVNNTSWTNGFASCQVGGTNSIVLSNDFGFNTRYTIYNTNANAAWDGDGMYYFGWGHIIRSNYIHGINASDPKNATAHCDGIQTYGIQSSSVMGYSHDCIIDDNLIDGTISGVMTANGNGVFAEGCSNIYVMNNVIRWHRGFTFTTVSFCPQVLNNDLIGQSNDAIIASIAFAGGLGTVTNGSQPTRIQNNICINWTNTQIVPGTTYSGLVCGNNLKYRYDGVAVGEDSSYTAAMIATDQENVNPVLVNVFANPPNPSIASASSGAIDNGASETGVVTNDWVGIPRPQGAAWDIGAFEFATDPLITVQPQNQTAAVGQTATFTVTATTGSPPLSYQWSKNGSSIAGATLSSYTTPATTIADNASTFTVQVCNSTNSCITSSSATLTVNSPPPSLFPAAKTIGGATLGGATP